MAWIITSSARDVEQCCGLQGELSQAPGELRSRESRSRAIGPRNNGAAGNRANEPKESCGLAAAMSSEERKQIVAPRQTTYWVSFMIKLLRAYGGCLGARRR